MLTEHMCNCTYLYGIPPLYRQNILADGYYWNPGSYAGKSKTFELPQSWEPSEILIEPTDLLEIAYSPRPFEAQWFRYVQAIDTTTWRIVGDAYMNLLGQCSEKCSKSNKCLIAFAATKYMWSNQNNSSWDNDIKDKFKNDKDTLVFKCYGIYSGYGVDVDYNYRIDGLPVWANENETDEDVLYSHFWTKSNLPYPYCTHGCTYPLGLPDEAAEDVTPKHEINWFDQRSHQWHHGSFSEKNELFKPQKATDGADILINPIDIVSYANVDLSVDQLIETPYSHDAWNQVIDAYHGLLEQCRSRCFEASDCHYAYAAVKYMSSADFSSSSPFEKDIVHDLKHDHHPTFVFKCYGLTQDKHKYLKSVDTTINWWKVTEWKDEYPDTHALLSHYYVNK